MRNSQKLMTVLFSCTALVMAVTLMKSIIDFNHSSVIVETENQERFADIDPNNSIIISANETEVEGTIGETNTEDTKPILAKYTSSDAIENVEKDEAQDYLEDSKLLNKLADDYDLQDDENITVFTVTQVSSNNGELAVEQKKQLIIGPHNEESTSANEVSTNEVSDNSLAAMIANEEIKVAEYQVAKAEEIERTTAYADEDAEEEFVGYVTKYTDLSNPTDITSDQINYIIDQFSSESSYFKNQGDAFITASKETGLNPIFLLCLAGQESGWNVTSLHRKLNNFYSIRMTDGNPGGGYRWSTVEEGIIEGGIWIYENYYAKGQNTLYSMIYGKKKYSSSADKWISHICSNMNRCYSILETL